MCCVLCRCTALLDRCCVVRWCVWSVWAVGSWIVFCFVLCALCCTCDCLYCCCVLLCLSGCALIWTIGALRWLRVLYLSMSANIRYVECLLLLTVPYIGFVFQMFCWGWAHPFPPSVRPSFCKLPATSGVYCMCVRTPLECEGFTPLCQWTE